MVLVLPVCMRLPFTSSHMARFCGSRDLVAVTTHGPSGAKVSKPLPLSQVGPRSSCQCARTRRCRSGSRRRDSAHRLPGTYFAVLPMTKASSTSQSDFLRLARQNHGVVGPADRGGRLHEDDRLARDRLVGFLGMIAVVQADRDELADVAHRRPETGAARHLGQALQRRLRGASPAPRCQSTAPSMSRTTPDRSRMRASPIEYPRLFLAGLTVTYQSHLGLLRIKDEE